MQRESFLFIQPTIDMACILYKNEWNHILCMVTAYWFNRFWRQRCRGRKAELPVDDASALHKCCCVKFCISFAVLGSAAQIKHAYHSPNGRKLCPLPPGNEPPATISLPANSCKISWSIPLQHCVIICITAGFVNDFQGFFRLIF